MEGIKTCVVEKKEEDCMEGNETQRKEEEGWMGSIQKAMKPREKKRKRDWEVYEGMKPGEKKRKRDWEVYEGMKPGEKKRKRDWEVYGRE